MPQISIVPRLYYTVDFYLSEKHSSGLSEHLIAWHSSEKPYRVTQINDIS